jgi:DNA (cytosine-5)-methyltransferase 1
MTHASLFSGIGGFDLAAKWMGWKNIFHCEIEKFGQKILKQHFPESFLYEDITKSDFNDRKGTVDVLTGGFPCQPFSVSGKQKGTADSRHLWPEMLRAVREIAPTYVVGENVYGLVSWSGGLVFDQVQVDLENEGYQVVPFLIPACGVGAPHRRYRIWFVAYSGRRVSDRWKDKQSNDVHQGKNSGRIQEENIHNRLHKPGFNPDTNDEGLEIVQRVPGDDEQECPTAERNGYRWEDWPAQPPLCGRNDGLPDRVDRIKALGNAIVPQVAYQIFKAIQLHGLTDY